MIDFAIILAPPFVAVCLICSARYLVSEIGVFLTLAVLAVVNVAMILVY